MGMILGSGGSGGRRGRRSLNAEINVTPFVDVMLVLLIVFIITAPLLVRGEEVSLPKTVSKPLTSDAQEPPLAITIRKDGTIYIQKTEITLDELGPKLNAILGEGYAQQIYIRGDEETDLGRALELIAEIKAVGYTRVAFVTEQKK